MRPSHSPRLSSQPQARARRGATTPPASLNAMGSLKPTVALAAALAALTGIDAHGGLIIPPCRNNRHNVDIFDFTKRPGELWLSGGSCAGDMCLWFNDGCFIGCPNCTSIVSTLPGASGEVPDRFIKPNCAKPTLMEPTLPEEARTWNIGNPSEYGDWTRHHPWRAPGHAPISDPCGRAGANTAQSGGGETPVGAKQFDRGSLLPKLNVVTKWQSGQKGQTSAILPPLPLPRPRPSIFRNCPTVVILYQS